MSPEKIIWFFLIYNLYLCVQGVEERCTLPIERGICRGFFRRFGFDRKTEECEEFVYGGCQGNKNNFQTYHHCRKTCIEDLEIIEPPDELKPTKPLPKLPVPPEVVSNKPSTTFKRPSLNLGELDNAVPMVQATVLPDIPLKPLGKPSVFSIESLDSPLSSETLLSNEVGISNNDKGDSTFVIHAEKPSQNEGQTKPSVDKAPISSAPDKPGTDDHLTITDEHAPETDKHPTEIADCVSPPVRGLCRGLFMRFNFNPSSGLCEEFMYGGCAGNGNRYKFRKDCEQTCLSQARNTGDNSNTIYGYFNSKSMSNQKVYRRVDFEAVQGHARSRIP